MKCVYSINKNFSAFDLKETHGISNYLLMEILLLDKSLTSTATINLTPEIVEFMKNNSINPMSRNNVSLLDFLICHDYINASVPIVGNRALFPGCYYYAMIPGGKWVYSVFLDTSKILIDIENSNNYATMEEVQHLIKLTGSPLMNFDNSVAVSVAVNSIMEGKQSNECD